MSRLLDAKGNIIDIATPNRKTDFKIEFGERFTVPEVWEIFKCNDETGGFEQLAGPLDKQQIDYAWQSLRNHPEFLGIKMFMVSVKRTPILSNFPPNVMRMQQLGITEPATIATLKPEGDND